MSRPLGQPNRPLHPSAQVAQGPARGTETVLVVDDDAPVRAMAGYMLGALGYRVLEAATTEDAVRQAGGPTPTPTTSAGKALSS